MTTIERSTMKTILIAMLALAPIAAHADDLFTKIDPAPRSELWVDTGFATYHYDRHADLNGRNGGLGAEYRFNAATAVTAGRFYNSNREYSSYAGVIWQPYSLGPAKLGAVVGAFNGYPHMRNGGWFPALIPVVTFEYERVGLNIGIVPSYKDRLYGGISFQLKFKLFE
jgi:hypothetical protein